MEKILNRGLNFAILPLNLDITQVLVDFKRFERSFVWKEFWFGKNIEEPYVQPLFKTTKTNLPKNYKVPNEVNIFLNSVKSEIFDYKNRNKAKCNIPAEEKEALGELIKLQKNRKIVIKPCDKGAGVIILDFEEYMRSCKEHLESEKVDSDGNTTKYYVEVNEQIVEMAKKKILNVIEEGLDNRIISKAEFEAMHPVAKYVGKFYCNFKVHKEHKINKAPPERPIVSACGSITENIGKFVQHHLDPLAKEHKSYIEDTPDLLRQIEDLNEREILPANSVLLTCDVIGLFTNIPQNDGIKAAEEALEERESKEVPTH